MNKFKVGDRVRVKENLVVDEFYDDGCEFTSDMEDTLGKVGEIVRVVKNEEFIRYMTKLDSDDYYYLYCFSPSMLEPITNDNKIEIYRFGDKCPYDCVNKFWDDFMNRIWAKMVIISNPEVIVIDENFNVFKAKCHRSDHFNPEIGLEICCKKKSMDELKNEREKKTNELTFIENAIKNLKKDLGKY